MENKKTVAAYDLDPSNGGMWTFLGSDSATEKCLKFEKEESDLMLGNLYLTAADATVVDLPAAPDNDVKGSMNSMESMLFTMRRRGFEPVLVCPVSSSDPEAAWGLNAALDIFDGAVSFAAFLNESTGSAAKEFSDYKSRPVDDAQGIEHASLRQRLLDAGGVEFAVPMLSEKVRKTVNQVRVMFSKAPDSLGGDSDAVEEFLDMAKIHVEAFVRAIEPGIQASGRKPVFLMYSTKGGQGKSFTARVLLEYLRGEWASGKKVERTFFNKRECPISVVPTRSI